MTNATVQPQEQDQAHILLAPVQADDKVKADAWEVYHNSEGQDFEKKLGALSLPQETKAALWNAKTTAARKPTQSKTEQPSMFENADKAVTDTLAPNARNLAPSGGQTGMIKEEGKTLGRELYSGVKSVASVVPSLYSMLTPALSEQEKKEGYTDTGRFGPVQVKRLAEPVVQAAKDYAGGRVGYQQILENAPEALGQGAGTVVSGKLLENAAPLIKFGSRVPKGAEALGTVPAPKTTTGLKPIITESEPSDTIPLRTGSKPTASADTIPLRSEEKPAANESKPTPKPRVYSVEQARHLLGDVVTDRLSSSKEGAEVLQRLTNGTHQQYADLGNALDVPKPKALSAKNGPEWTASELKRTIAAHGKELGPTKEVIARHLVENNSPTEIMQHTEHWVNPDVKPIKPMSSLTERTMKALNLSEEAKNDMRRSGVSDAEAQRLLAKLTKRQLENLSKTMEAGEHLPTVSGGSHAADVATAPQVGHAGNAVASVEELSRPGKH